MYSKYLQQHMMQTEKARQAIKVAPKGAVTKDAKLSFSPSSAETAPAEP